MFPTDYTEMITEENETVGCDFAFDYESGQHLLTNGSLEECSNIQGIKQFIQNVLRTKLNAYRVYIDGEIDNFGISIYNYLGQRTLPLGYLNSELKREVTEQLLKHTQISSVSNWQGKRERQGLSISFTVTLVDGTEIKESDFNVQSNIV
ncbi:MAG: DUF2634 domain-containing protein [Lachnospirales bacterium]